MEKSSAQNTIHQCNLDLMHLLVSILDVQEIIINIRNKYGIPEEGINPGEDLTKWNEENFIKRWEEWDQDTRAIWKRAKQLAYDDRYIEHIRTFILTNIITAPLHNYAIGRTYSEEKLKEFNVKIYKNLAKEEKTILFKEMKKLMEKMEPSMLKGSRPKWGIDEDIFILQNFEKMKLTGNYSTNRNSNSSEGTKISKDRNEKTYQRRVKEIKDRIGWDASCSN